MEDREHEQQTITEQTASEMRSSAVSGSGAGPTGSAAELTGDVQEATGAETHRGRRLRLRFPPAPGGLRSPQVPGAVPDFTSIPGERVERIPRVAAVHHPSVEEGTAQGIMDFFALAPGEEDTSDRWELGPTTFEEQRKATPSLLTPSRPQLAIAPLVAPVFVAEQLPPPEEPALPLAAVVERARE